MMEITMNETRAVKDLGIGDLIQVEGFEGDLTIRSARKIKKVVDAGKLEVTLVAPDGQTETMALAPDEQVQVVGKDARGGKAKGTAQKAQSKGKGKTKGKAKAKAKPQPEAEKLATPAPEPAGERAVAPAPEPAAETAPAPEPERVTEPAGAPAPQPQAAEASAPQAAARTPKRSRRQQKVEGEKKLSALDAAAKVLGETGQAMTSQELIGAMAAKGYWTSPGGKTPHATLYAAMLREITTKGDGARFVKTQRGKFALREAQAQTQGD
jgi:hypothetical protein